MLALESARQLGHDVTVVALEEEASAEVEALAPECHWISLGELSKLIDILKREGIREVDDVRAGEARQDLLLDSSRLAAGETAGVAAIEKIPMD